MSVYIFILLQLSKCQLNFFILGLGHVNENTDPEGWDTIAYLQEANLIKNNGGTTDFFKLCLNGKYKQSNQHPLYILLLSPFASREISFFIIGTILTEPCG